MRISNIVVNGLFDRFTHNLNFSSSERISIIYGPNGFGKTMILRILNVLFNHSPRSLGRMPFEDIHVQFDDGTRLIVTRESGVQYPRLTFITSTRKTHSFTPEPQIRPQEIPFPLGAIDEIIPHLEQIGPSEWRNIHTDEPLDLDDVIATYGEFFPFDDETPEHRLAVPQWLADIRESIPVRFIDTERLTDLSTEALRQRHRRAYFQMAPERTVRRYSDSLAQMVKQTLTEYATLSQSLDRTFPARLVEETPSKSPSTTELNHILAKVEERRSEIVQAGLLLQEHESLSLPAIETMDDSRRSVLAVYAQDATSKLSVFDDLYSRVNTFTKIANARLLYKRVSVSQEGLKISNSDGSILQPEMLSSGEQHEIVILFDLLFGTKKNSLILIDEPELSLHVAWQREMLKDLQEMADLSDFRALLATHSPQIIGDRWDLTIRLQGPDGQ